jgi:hypothetical protein
MKTFLIALEDSQETYIVLAANAEAAVQSVRSNCDVEGYPLFAVDLSKATTMPVSPGDLTPELFELDN